MGGDVRVDAARRRVACLGPEHDRTCAEVGGAVEDLCGDIGVRAVAVQQLAGDRDAGLAQPSLPATKGAMAPPQKRTKL